MSTFNGFNWTGLPNFASAQYAQQFAQLIADIYEAFRQGGYYITATIASQAPVTGSSTYTIAVDRNTLGVGMIVLAASNSNPQTNWVVGVVTAATTTSITINGLAALGSTADTAWNLCALGMARTTAPGSTRMGQTGQTSAVAALSALNLDTPSISAEAILDDFLGAYVAGYLDRWKVSLTNGGVLKANAAPYYNGDVAQYNLDPSAAVSTLRDWASHPGVLALEGTVASDAVILKYGLQNTFPYGIGNTSAHVNDVHFKIPTGFTAADSATFMAGISGATLGTSDGLCFVVGRAGFNPMQLYALEIAAGVSRYTDSGYTLRADRWYTVRQQRTRISLAASDTNISVASSAHSMLLASATFTANTIAVGLNAQIKFTKTNGSSKRAVLVDYFMFKPGALTR